MPNRHERRAQKAQRQHYAKLLTPEDKEDFKQMVRGEPGYVRDTGKLSEAFERWRLLHPEAKPVWLDTKGTMLLGMPLDDEQARGYVAGNADAHAAVIWVDEATGKRGTLFQVQCVLSELGWTK